MVSAATMERPNGLRDPVQRARIQRKIEALRGVRVDRGAAPAEADKATATADKLERQYNLSPTRGNASCTSEQRNVRPNQKPKPQFVPDIRPWFTGRLQGIRVGRKHDVRYALWGVADTCECDYTWSDDTGALVFHGEAENAAIAHEVTRLLTKMIDDGYRQYSKCIGVVPSAKVSSDFKGAMAEALASAIVENSERGRMSVETRMAFHERRDRRREAFKAWREASEQRWADFDRGEPSCAAMNGYSWGIDRIYRASWAVCRITTG